MFAAHNALFTGATSIAPVVYRNRAIRYGTSVTLPAHNIGDIIVFFAYRPSSSQAGKPAASGTVPTWTDIDATAGTGNGSMRTAYTIATRTDTTSGTWSSAYYVGAIVLSGQSATNPIGGHALSYSSYDTNAICPSVTMSKTDGTSQLLYIAASEGATWNSTFSTSGYTSRYDGYGLNESPRFVTKNVTTTDGSLNIGTYTSASYWAATTIEIRAW